MADLNSQAKFSAAPLGLDMPRSTFNRTFNYKATANAGMLVPFMVDEIYPGDTVDLRAVMMARMTTPLFPVMDSCWLEQAVFFVPYRLCWEHFKNFMGENDVSQWVEDTEYLVPQQPVGTDSSRTVGDLSHHFGIPVACPVGSTINGLYHRAYRLIWNEWFRDQNVQAPVPILKTDNNNPADYNVMLPVNRVKDYFGACLPNSQKGDMTRIAVSGTAPVGSNITNFDAITSTAGVDVDTLRLAVQTQRILERMNLGSRYVEFVRNFFGVTSPDGRQQRPELLGYSKRMLNMQDVPQTAAGSEGQTPLGTVGAYSKTFADDCKFTHSFTEHGALIGVYWIRHNRTYCQGINRIFRRRRFEDFYLPQLAHIGDQPVYTSELFNNGLSPLPASSTDAVFGYQEAWAELRYKPSICAGLLDVSVNGTIGDAWTYADLYTQAPVLSDSWMREGSAEVARTLAVTDEDQFIIDCNVSYLHTRCLPVYSIPGLVDHF